MQTKKLFYLFCMAAVSLSITAAPVKIVSPNGKLEMQITTDKKVSLKLLSNGKTLMEIDSIGLETDRGLLPSPKANIRKVQKTSVNRTIKPVIKEKRAEIPECYNEATLEFSDKTKLQFRLYNEGIAYRFILASPPTPRATPPPSPISPASNARLSPSSPAQSAISPAQSAPSPARSALPPDEILILQDRAHFLFDSDASLTFQKDNNNPTSDYEKPYVTQKIGELNDDDMGNLPALVQTPSGECILFLEANTYDYPVMWIKKSVQGLTSHYWGVPSGYNSGGNQYNRKKTTGNKDYIAQTKASRDFPWKAFAVAEKEADLLTNQLVYLLGEECKIKDPSWVKPGWVTFDWWSRRGIYGVDFKAGINNETAKYMIDFAAEFGLQYFLFDDGWTYKEDLTQAIPGLDIAEVVRYADTKNIDVMLWITYALFDDQMDVALKKFKEWGIKGVKIDFMNRSDQEVVDFYWRAAEACANYQMVVNFHGAYRPDGLRRAYPNVLTREALIEFEYNGVRDWVSPDHHCTLPFIRNVAGPMDFIPGTMNNATQTDFRTNGNKPMGQGTRAHAIALAVIFESPMQMLSDAQPLYYRDRECTEFLTQIPVEWDDIVPLEAKVGDFVALARRSGDDWYVAAITDWTPREMEIRLDFLADGEIYQMEYIQDGINADTTAVDYKKEVKKAKKGDVIKIDLAPGGGWVAKLTCNSIK